MLSGEGKKARVTMCCTDEFLPAVGDPIVVAQLLRCMSLLLAQSGHPDTLNQCPLLGDMPRDFSITYRAV
jgi:hypothetical protein